MLTKGVTMSIKSRIAMLIVSALAFFAVPTYAQANVIYYIYDDAFADDWQYWGWSSEVDLADTTDPYQGTHHISWDPEEGYAGFYFRSNSGVDTTGYTHLTFAIQSTQEGDTLSVLAYDADNEVLGPQLMLADYGGNPVVGSYKVYQIPLEDLNAVDIQLHGFHIQDQTGDTRPVMYIDQVGLIDEFYRPLLTLTFDDSAKTQMTYAWPIMQDYSITGTFYVLTGLLDSAWHMTTDDVLELHKSGNHIASHTATHRRLTELSPEEVEEELAQSKAYLEDLLGIPILDCASPFGSYDDIVLEQISEHYRSHRCVRRGYNTKENLDLSRILVQQIKKSTTAEDVAEWIATAQEQNSWLVLMYHEIKPDPGRWDTTPEQFESHLQVIQESGIAVVNLDAAIEEILSQP
jgi:peptidoglycan/xylan/chitin deacetylase (PgdA/CDA1 family)